MEVYYFIKSQADTFDLKSLCRAVSVSRSAYYAWRKGQTYTCDEQQQGFMKKAEEVFIEHKRRYGSRRIVHELRAAESIYVGRHRVRRWMSHLGLQAIQPRRFVPRTTDSRNTRQPSPNLLIERDIAITRVNQVWVGDITYLPLQGGKWLYLATWIDLYSRTVVGWHLAEDMRAELV